MTGQHRLIGTPVPPPKPCKRRGCTLTRAAGDVYHVSKEGHVHRGGMPANAPWQEIVEWAKNVHGIMGWS